MLVDGIESGRIEFAGALYHALGRGDWREAIFADEEDRAMFPVAIGRLTREQTAVGNGWIAERLSIGHVSRVSRYCNSGAASLMESVLAD